MKCPFCGFMDSKVIETRTVEETNSIRRRRECLECQQRFTTYEKLESIPLVVIKKDKTRETFDREKVLAGIITACEKRQVPTAKMEAMVDEIEQQLLNSLEREIPSSAIGELVMEKLKEVDEVAYVRFASVYRQFKDINTFVDFNGLVKTDSVFVVMIIFMTSLLCFTGLRFFNSTVSSNSVLIREIYVAIKSSASSL